LKQYSGLGLGPESAPVDRVCEQPAVAALPVSDTWCR
jgi:hypothetical protein